MLYELYNQFVWDAVYVDVLAMRDQIFEDRMNEATRPIRVLLLENEGIVRAGFKALMQKTVPDALLYEAACYEQSIALLSRESIDFAFLDFNLCGEHEKTGLDVLHYLRLNGLDTRAVMLSGYADMELIHQCLKSGAWGYIPKSMDDPAVFAHALETIFQERLFLPAQSMGYGGDVCGQGLFLAPSRSADEFGIKGRSLEVLYYLCQGYENKMIAHRLCLAEGTVRKDYVSRLLKQFKVKNRTQLVMEVARLGIVIPKPTQRFCHDKAE